ncbi:hypothetical protein E5358_03930 [Palleniella muris]|uniref:Uncharacterized protein n=1 Tax=Palleniella muris TaxID=3038145 RepID=A0AC61QSP6_9BACT|nr:hypothetical protein [Palleniella muris]TGX83413.1 hypothetical protein E5358_03930 [Palleniella muris]
MKKTLLLLFPILLFSCNKDTFNSESAVFTLSGFTDTGCKEGAKAKGTMYHDVRGEYVNYKVKKGDDGGMHIYFDHVNSMFNCGSDKIWVETSKEGNTIRVHEIENSNAANCYCDHDIHFEVGALEKDDYTIMIHKNLHEAYLSEPYAQFTVKVTNDSKGKYTISE